MGDAAAAAAAVPGEAVAVPGRFVEAVSTKDTATMRGLMSAESLASGQFDDGGPPEGVRFTIGDGRMEGDVAVIAAHGKADVPVEGQPSEMKMEIVMVAEADGWKVCLGRTMDRMFGGSVEQVMETMAEGLRGAMEGVGEALGEGLKGAFGDSETEEETPQEW